MPCASVVDVSQADTRQRCAGGTCFPVTEAAPCGASLDDTGVAEAAPRGPGWRAAVCSASAGAGTFRQEAPAFRTQDREDGQLCFCRK